MLKINLELTLFHSKRLLVSRDLWQGGLVAEALGPSSRHGRSSTGGKGCGSGGSTDAVQRRAKLVGRTDLTATLLLCTLPHYTSTTERGLDQAGVQPVGILAGLYLYG